MRIDEATRAASVGPEPETTRPPRRSVRELALAFVRWFDSGAGRRKATATANDHRVDWARVMPFVGMHVMCFFVLVCGVSWFAVGVAAALYFVRMFAITGFYHRYFSHRAYKTSRFWQLAFAIAGNSAVQRGPLWWASHHRLHHAYSDGEKDVHSPIRHGFLWSHIGWLTSRANFATETRVIGDLARYPELRFLDRFDILVPIVLAVVLFFTGQWLGAAYPALGTSGFQLLVWGFFVSTVVLFHGTCAINSIAHLFGRRRFATKDASRNSMTLALVTLGEGWHNNHHKFPGMARQGLRWWEVDVTYYGLKLLALVGIIRDLRPPPPEALS